MVTYALRPNRYASTACAIGRLSTSELRLLVAVRRVCREEGGTVPSTRLIDALLDERGELTRS